MKLVSQSHKNWTVFAYIILIGFTLLTTVPLIWLLYSSFKSNMEIAQNVFALPNKFYVHNYVRVWELAKMGTLFKNSLIYSIISTIITVYLATSAGYALTKLNQKISKYLYSFFMMGLLITAHAILVPLFLMENFLQINNTRIGVILPYVAFGLPFLIYLSTSYIKGIPNTIIEAAVVDGASYTRILHSIIFPMSRPIVTTMTIFSFLANWNEFAFMLVLTSSEKLRSLPIGLNAFAGGRTRNLGYLFAALSIATIPMLLFYAIFYRRIVEGFSAGAIKE